MPWNRTADAMPVSMAETIAHVRITLADSVPDLARGRGPYRCQSQDGSRCHPGGNGMARLSPVGVRGRRQALWPARSRLAGRQPVRREEPQAQDPGVRQFLYTCDLNYNWEHFIAVEVVEDGQLGVNYPRHLDGARPVRAMASAERGSRPFSRSSPTPNILSVRKPPNGIVDATAKPSTLEKFDELQANSELQIAPNAALQAKPLFQEAINLPRRLPHYALTGVVIVVRELTITTSFLVPGCIIMPRPVWRTGRDARRRCLRSIVVRPHAFDAIRSCSARPAGRTAAAYRRPRCNRTRSPGRSPGCLGAHWSGS